MLTMTLLLLAIASGADAENALPNASFEDTSGKPDGWDTHVWNGAADFKYVQEGRAGSRCVRVASESGADVAWFRAVPVEPFSTYRLSGWIRTDNVTGISGEGALLNIHDGSSAKSKALTGTNDWTEVSFEFETGESGTITINCLFGGWGQATGTAWYDDLRLERVASKEMNPSITIDADRTGAPVSKYIYGQFIEHLGRCIYGGIWAEMLTDRKFFYPIGAADSPWKPADGTTVTMVSEGAYGTGPSPEIPAGASITQGGLGVLAGKSYSGRIVLAGTGTVRVTLKWGEDPNASQAVPIEGLTSTFEKHPLEFTAGAATDDALLIISGSDAFRIGAVSLMPADNVKGMRADTLAVLKELNAPIYRWPGGNFVSGYNWRDGLGDPDLRPTRKNPAWEGIEYNDFGIHEFMAFCEELGTEPYIAVNSGLGTVEEARAEVEYLNGAEGTPMGQLRAANGRPQPWGVHWWGIGNEMYGDWQLGYMPLADYVNKHNAYAEAMRAVDPSIHLIGVGATGEWSLVMLSRCADHMDSLSEHFYCGEKPGLIEHVRQIADNVRGKAEAHRRYWAEIPAVSDRRIRIALDEYNYWYGPHMFGELGTRYFLQDALGIAGGIHELIRNSDVFIMANYAQTVNVIGCIKTSKTAAAFETTGLALKLYRNHFGVTPLEVSGDLNPLDVVAAWNEGRTAVTVGIVNPTPNAVEAVLSLKGAVLAGNGAVRRLTGPDRMAFNEPGLEPTVTLSEEQLKEVRDHITLPALSVSLYELPAR